jgi:endoglycosylceramidase
VGEAADTLVASWAYWQFKGFGDFNSISTASSGLYDDEGELNQRKLRALTRTYI